MGRKTDPWTGKPYSGSEEPPGCLFRWAVLAVWFLYIGVFLGIVDLAGVHDLTTWEFRTLPFLLKLLYLGAVLLFVRISWWVAAYTVALVAARSGHGKSLDRYDRWKNP